MRFGLYCSMASVKAEGGSMAGDKAAGAADGMADGRVGEVEGAIFWSSSRPRRPAAEVVASRSSPIRGAASPGPGEALVWMAR